MPNLFVRKSFDDSVKQLSPDYQSGSLSTAAEFQASVLMAAKNPECLPGYNDIYTLRVTDRYRIAIMKLTSIDWLLLFVGPHDTAYEWIKKHKKYLKNIDRKKSNYKTFDSMYPDYVIDNDSEEKEPVSAETIKEKEELSNGLYSEYSDKDLLRGLSGTNELEIVRTWETVEDREKSREELCGRSNIFLDSLMDTGSPGKALHSLFIHDKHIEADNDLSMYFENIRKSYNENSYLKKDCFSVIRNVDYDTIVISGFSGIGKTTELIRAIESRRYSGSDGQKAAFIVSNPDYFSDTESYIKIILGEIPEYLDVMTFDGLFEKIMMQKKEQWKLHFSLHDFNEQEIKEFFYGCIEDRDKIDTAFRNELETEWCEVVEYYGLYSKSGYESHLRAGQIYRKKEILSKYWNVFDKFIKKMDETGQYTKGYALQKVSALCKSKLYDPYIAVFADDIHFLTRQQQEFLDRISHGSRKKRDNNVYSIDPVFFNHYLAAYSVPFLSTVKSDLTLTEDSNRVYGKKYDWLISTEKGMTSAADYLWKTPMKIKGSQVIKKAKPQLEMEKENLIAIKGIHSYKDKNEVIDRIVQLMKDEILDPDSCVIVVSDQNELEFFENKLRDYGIEAVAVEYEYSQYDYLLDKGVRLCTLRRLGCMTFDNVIIPVPSKMMITESNDYPFYVKNSDEKMRFLSRIYLFKRAVCASFKKTYYFASDTEENLFDILSLRSSKSITHG